MAKKSCKKGYYYCYASKKCKRLPMGYVVGMGGWLRKEKEEEKSSDDTESTKKNGNGNGSNGNGNGNGGSNGGSNGGGVSEAWSAKYKKSIDCNNPKGFSQRAHCRGRKMNEEIITEKRDGKSAKSKGYSLRDWFKGGGWVQAGGKYDGKPCAKQPGQKTKPFCRDADDRANMSKKERSRRAAKKRREDPNPNRKGKAKMVSASYSNWRADLEQLDEGAAQAIRLGLAAGTAIGGAILGKKAHDAIKGVTDRRNKRLDDALRKARGIREGRYSGGGGLRPGDRIKMLDGSLKSIKDLDAKLKEKGTKKEEVQMEGKKDACYHKVKSRYSVWPSAYASGALVKCRKVGAKNWGNKTKKEGYEFSNWRDDFQATEYESIDIIKAEPLQPSQPVIDEAGKKCWKGYKKAGTQKLFGKTYNRCVKAHFSDWRADMELQEAIPGYDKYNDAVAAAKKLSGRKKIDALKAAAKLRPATEKEVNQKIGESVKPDKKLPLKKLGPTRRPFPQPGDKRPERPPGPGHEEPLPPWDDPLAKLKSNRKSVKEDWQKSNRNDGVDGMSQKSVNAYKRENPGSKLQTAVTGKVKKGSKDAKRRKSFCSRSKGQKDMHNIDCSKTPDKKICKARRRWKC